MTPTLHTLTSLLNPWRTIRRLDATVQRLQKILDDPLVAGIEIGRGTANFSAGFRGSGPQLLAGMFLGLLQEHPEAVNYLQLTFGSPEGPILVTVQRPGGASPHDLRAMAEQEARNLRDALDAAQGQLETAREALWRLHRWGGWPLSPFASWDADTTIAVATWLQTGMTGPLPPLPEYLAKWEEVVDGEAP